MKSKLFAGAIVLAGTTVAGAGAMAATESVIYSFPSGSAPYAQLKESPMGALFGTTFRGGNGGYGTVYELLDKQGVWKESTIHTFDFADGDGIGPRSGLVIDTSGVLYGTTDGGGHGWGTVFSLSHGGGGWTETVLYAFTGGADGKYPHGKLWRDAATGTLYGTTERGGAANCGTVFALSQSGGTWTESVLHSFQGRRDGCYPVTGVQPGLEKGTYFGTTNHGGNGAGNGGTVYMLTDAGGVWTESVIYAFTGGSDGYIPIDFEVEKDGNIYGVAQLGGAGGLGAVFEVGMSNGVWQETTLHNFGVFADGANPVGIRAAAGNIYGTTEYGGTYNDGTVFKLTPSGGSWTEFILHSFGAAGDGITPQSRPIQDPNTGVLYGTTVNGGQYDGGTAYMITE